MLATDVYAASAPDSNIVIVAANTTMVSYEADVGVFILELESIMELPMMRANLFLFLLILSIHLLVAS
ncbi:MAG: hypothetical protein DLM72_15845 [Candidatus Nitrosopolaris wilkensis]|nr:MAG: hypothetical protein DLM72_15845 [Candidatus Nitrosopolaris wilkensis]